MNLCYLYNKKISYPNVDTLLSQFDGSERIDLSTQKCTKEYGIYILDVGDLDKESAGNIRSFFKKNQNALVYMVSPKTSSATFYQLAFLLKAKSIITAKQEPDKIAHLIKNAYSMQVFENKSLYVGRFVAESQCYMIFKQSELHYASDTLMKNFECNSLEEVKEKVCSRIDLGSLLSHKEQVVSSGQFFEVKDGEEKLDVIKSIYRNDEYLLTIDRFDLSKLQCSSEKDLTTRLKFIDILKERLVEETEKHNYMVVTIKIVNFKKIGNLIGKSEQENFVNQFLDECKRVLAGYLVFSEYYHDFFVTLYKDHDFQELQQKAETLYNDLEEFFKKFNFKIEIALHVMEINELELGTVLSILDSIRSGKLSKKEINKRKIRYIGKYKENMSDKEIVSLLLDDSFINDVDLKLVNIYKGMVIDSPTKILKKDRNAIYVIVKQIQGAVMSLTKETILRSDAFAKDIKAHVAFVDRKRKIAKLENFKVIEQTPSTKESCKVDFAKKNKAILSLIGTKISAEIIDISSNSISIKLNKMRSMEKMLNKDVEITFTIPTKRTREGEVTITEEAKISYIECQESKECKIVCEFKPNSKNKNLIIEYVHNRQVEIIEELKKLNY